MLYEIYFTNICHIPVDLCTVVIDLCVCVCLRERDIERGSVSA